jgi:hypothetical protein
MFSLNFYNRRIAAALLQCLEFAAVLDNDRLGGGTALAADRFDQVHHIQTRRHLAKDNVLTIQPGCVDLRKRNKTDVVSLGDPTMKGPSKNRPCARVSATTYRANEELRTVRTGSGVRHTQDSPTLVLELEVFVLRRW